MSVPAPRVLFDLAGAEEDRRFSPYCWRTRMALAHKGLDVEARPWRFTDKEAIAFAGARTVPVLADGDRAIADSWAIALYLEEAYPDRPSLFGGAGAIGPTHLLNAWTDRVMVAGIAPLIIADIHACLHEKDRAYFRESREKRLGGSLESVMAGRETRVEQFRKSLDPLRVALKDRPFLGGAAPLYADYIPFAALQWARCTSDFALLAADDTLQPWFDRLLDAHGGLARRARI
ncbi:MAG: glutathione S-transferase family protein [Rhodospirillales bacterium]|nr:glutathione S-transferase family protein [Rhodospirillales bacterium]